MCAGGSIPITGLRSGCPSVVTNTWQATLDRLLLGSAVFDADLGWPPAMWLRSASKALTSTPSDVWPR